MTFSRHSGVIYLSDISLNFFFSILDKFGTCCCSRMWCIFDCHQVVAYFMLIPTVVLSFS